MRNRISTVQPLARPGPGRGSPGRGAGSRGPDLRSMSGQRGERSSASPTLTGTCASLEETWSSRRIWVNRSVSAVARTGGGSDAGSLHRARAKGDVSRPRGSGTTSPRLHRDSATVLIKENLRLKQLGQSAKVHDV